MGSTPTWGMQLNNLGGSMLLNIVLWAITLYLVYVFVTAGRAKLNNDPMMIGAFDAIGPVGGLTPTQFRKITGGIELLSSIFLIIPPLTSFGATLLVCTMIGALLAHYFVFKGGYQKPAILLALSFIVMVFRW